MADESFDALAAQADREASEVDEGPEYVDDRTEPDGAERWRIPGYGLVRIATLVELVDMASECSFDVVDPDDVDPDIEHQEVERHANRKRALVEGYKALLRADWPVGINAVNWLAQFEPELAEHVASELGLHAASVPDEQTA